MNDTENLLPFTLLLPLLMNKGCLLMCSVFIHYICANVYLPKQQENFTVH